MRKLLTTLTVLTAMALTLTLPCSALGEGVLRVGMECNYAPFNWTQAEPGAQAVPLSSGGYADGYDVQLALLIASGLGMELEIIKTEWDGLIPGVTSGITDAIIAGMSPTDERRLSIDFSDSYYTSELVLVVRRDSAFANAAALADFAGAAVTGQLNTVHYGVIDQIPGVSRAMAMETFPAMIVALQSGAIDAYVAERPGAVADTAANPGLTYIQFAPGAGFTVTEDEVSVAVGLRQGSALTARVNEILAGISQETRERLMLEAIARQPLSEAD